jgi:DNA invertase Pin-like site-specific DNA recombinase
MEIAIYIRKSTTDKQENSLMVQYETMKQYIGGEKPSKVFSDKETGRNMKREGLLEAFAWLDQDKDRVLVFYKVCRYGRSLDNFEGLRRYIDRNQVRFMDLGPMGRAIDFTMLQLKLVLAEQESRLMGERISATHKVLAMQGKAWGKTADEMEQMRQQGLQTRRAQRDEWCKKAFEFNHALTTAGFTNQGQRVEKMNELGFTTLRGKPLTASALSKAVSRHNINMKREAS